MLINEEKAMLNQHLSHKSDSGCWERQAGNSRTQVTDELWFVVLYLMRRDPDGNNMRKCEIERKRERKIPSLISRKRTVPMLASMKI